MKVNTLDFKPSKNNSRASHLLKTKEILSPKKIENSKLE